jgi:hypothetical protein
VREIRLTNGGCALVDDEDFALASLFTWRAFRPRNVTYAVTQRSRRDGGNRTVYMHDLVTGDRQIDHVNGDGLDNRRANLRRATASENQANVSGRGGLSRFRGVSLSRGYWRAYISLGGKQVHLGHFKSEAEAALAYNQAAQARWGSFARLNEVEI